MRRIIVIRVTVIVAVLIAVALLIWYCLYFEQTPIKNGDALSSLPASPPVAALPTPNGVPDVKSSSEPEIPTASSTGAVSGGQLHSRFGALEIRGKKIKIADNIDEATLKKSPGWIPDSALPGEEGMCVILGHRNSSHLRVLQNVKVGDEIKFIYSDGREAIYKAADVIIYESTSDWHLPALDGSTLVLVTCYPFRYSGNAPGKFILVCNMT